MDPRDRPNVAQGRRRGAIGSFDSRTRNDDLVLFISDHGFQSVTRTIHMDHLLKKFGFLEFSASNVVFGPMQWGPVRKVARKAYDFLGPHGPRCRSR